MTVLRLACRPQHYSWGKLGLNSEVAQLLQNSDPKWTIDASTPYAELWMGAHPKADSAIIWDHVENHVEEKTLGTWIQKNPQSLGTKVREKFNDRLPFLFKVLSVRNALSIQAHPDKDLAMQLHARSPQNYPDENHKPEMCIALTPFTGLCGFRPVTEVLDFLSELPELVVLLGPDCVEKLRSGLSDLDQTRAALKSCFSQMMRSDKDLVQTQLRTLVQRAEARGPVPLQDLLLELHSQFPGDIGCFCLFFLNLVQLQPGDAMFLRANEIHAYLSGDCVEVMACSDNTVRAGLTPKFLDVETLCEMLDYSPDPPTSKRFPCRRDEHDSHVTLYNPPIDDFSVIRTQVSGTESYVIPPLDSGSILLVISGSANCPAHSDIRLGRGSVLFLSANQSLPLEVTSSIDMYRACCLL
uniref:Mannose-6-phosphate isomerase n=1 Tax=Knipowitschia caucasica TaxID=637954 RepID=A0AAV2L6A2_KNICA